MQVGAKTAGPPNSVDHWGRGEQYPGTEARKDLKEAVYCQHLSLARKRHFGRSITVLKKGLSWIVPHSLKGGYQQG